MVSMICSCTVTRTEMLRNRQTDTHTHTHTQDKYCNPCARRLIIGETHSAHCNYRTGRSLYSCSSCTVLPRSNCYIHFRGNKPAPSVSVSGSCHHFRETCSISSTKTKTKRLDHVINTKATIMPKNGRHPKANICSLHSK